MRTGWWPPDIPFDTTDMATVFAVLEEGNKR